MPNLKWTVEEAARRVGITSASQLAERADLAQGTATSLWHGRQLRVDMATLQRVCNALQCTPNDLLGVDTGEKSEKDRAPGRLVLVG